MNDDDDWLPDPDDVPDVKAFGALLKQLCQRHARARNETPLSIRELADKTGYSKSAIGNYLNGTTLPDVAKLDALLQVLKASPRQQRRLSTIRERLQDLDRRAVTRIHNIGRRNLRFVGRDSYLELMRKSLDGGPEAALLVIKGLGGVGKSQLAGEFVHRHGAHYEVAWRINAEEPPLIPGQFTELGERLGLTEPSVDDVMRKLDELSRWLLIFDNAESPDDVRAFLPPGRGHVLVTTRAAGFGALGEVLELAVFSRAEAVAMLSKRIDDADLLQAERLAELLGDLPLALEQASSYIERTGCPIADYLEAIAENTESMLDRGQVTGYRDNLAEVWRVSFERLAKGDPAVPQLLDLLGNLAGTPIPLALFTEGARLLPDPLRRRLADRMTFVDTVGALVELSLVRRSGDTVEIHRLLQAAIRRQTASRSAEIVTVLLALLRSIAPQDVWPPAPVWGQWRMILPHVLRVLEHSPAATHGSPDSVWLLDHAGTYLHAAGQADAAIPLLRKAYDSAVDRADRLAVRSRLATALRDDGAHAEAEEHCREVCAAHEADGDTESAEALTRLSELGGILLYRGKYEESEQILCRVLAGRTAALGADHHDTLGTYNDLACLRLLNGDHEAGAAMLRPIIAAWTQAYGVDDRRTLNALNNLCFALGELGELAEAESVARRVLEGRERTNGPRHPNTMTAMTNLAKILQRAGDTRTAERLHRAVLARRSEVHGASHPDAVYAQVHLARMLIAVDRSSEATRLLEPAMPQLESALGPDHPKTAEVRELLASLRCP